MNSSHKPGTPVLVIRATTCILAGLIATACSSLPGLDFAELTLRPQYHLAKLRGKTRMQSAPGGGPIVDNAAMDLKTFGTRKRDDDYGGIVAYGDGFSGFEFGYAQFDIDSTERGTLTADYGMLPNGTRVVSSFRLEEFRLRYIGQIFEYETEDEVSIRLGIGPLLAHREATFTATEDGTALSQITRFKDDGVLYSAARLRGEYRGFSVTADYAWSDLNFGGEFEGPMQDYSVLASYALEDQDIKFFAGFRWVELPASRTQNSFQFDHDFRLEGWMLGAELTF